MKSRLSNEISYSHEAAAKRDCELPITPPSSANTSPKATEVGILGIPLKKPRVFSGQEKAKLLLCKSSDKNHIHPALREITPQQWIQMFKLYLKFSFILLFQLLLVVLVLLQQARRAVERRLR